jgi:Tfp pilus assembly protein PilN
MKRHVNLMSSSARVRTIVRTRIRQWSLACICVVTVFAPLLLYSWWPVYQKGQNIAVLEAQYEPIRQQKISNRAFQEQIEQIHANEHIALALAKIDTPVVTLLGLVGKAVSGAHESVVLERVKFSQDTMLQNANASNTEPAIDLAGFGLDDNAVNLFASSLQAAFPFGKVELQLSEYEEIHQQRMQRFVIHCSLDARTEE